VVSAGLNELSPIIEIALANQVPEDLSRATLKALEKETAPETAALLAAFLEHLGRVAVTRGDYAGFEFILDALEKEPNDVAHDHISALAHRLVAQDRWLLLVDASLSNRALIQSSLAFCSVIRSLVDRFDAAAYRAAGFRSICPPWPVWCAPSACRFSICLRLACTKLDANALARPSRFSPRPMPIGSCAASRAPRQLGVEPSGLGGQRTGAPLERHLRAEFGLRFFPRAGRRPSLVVPMNDRPDRNCPGDCAFPQLMEIAAGEHEHPSRSVCPHQGIEALGRMRALDAAELLRTLATRRDGLAYAEPPACVRPLKMPWPCSRIVPHPHAPARLLPHPGNSNTSFVVQRRYAAFPSNRRSVRRLTERRRGWLA